MADNRQELRSVNWNEIFSFSHIFKSFRMAIHLSKLSLALAAIIVIFLTGWVMDRIWSAAGAYVQVDRTAAVETNEIGAYFAWPAAEFEKYQDDWLEGRDAAAAGLRIDAQGERYYLSRYTDQLSKLVARDGHFRKAFDGLKLAKQPEGPPSQPELKSLIAEGRSKNLREAEDDLRKEIKRVEELIDEAYKQAQNDVKEDASLVGTADKEKALERVRKDRRAALQAITLRKQDFTRLQETIRGRSIFASLCDYESSCLSNALAALCRADISPGMNVYQNIVRRKAGQPVPAGAEANMPSPNDAGFLFWVLAAVHGIKWFICQQWFYAIIFLLISLAAWAFFGGAIHRIAALHAAREEKISISQALRFSASKFLSFFVAPLMPLAAILGAGALLIVGGIIGNIMGFGAVLVGALFLLAILLGLLIAFVAVGLVAGAGLMYPTIAVEGSDAFDAISRSFSYVFAKPWRAIVYGVIALVYGALCYLFVRFFAFLALAATHFFVKVGVWTGGDTLREGADKLDVMWAKPTFSVFHASSNWQAMSTAEQLGAFLISIWVYLVIGIVLAFALCYCSSASTVIYYLLRRKVDATDLDDVYVEEAEETPPVGEAQVPETGEAPAAEEAEGKAPKEGEGG